MTHDLTLYHYWRSSCSWRIRWALILKGVDYRSQTVNILAGEHKAPEFRAVNPTGYLPALAIDGEPYGESLALLDWIEETWPEPPLLPQERLSRLYVRQLAHTVAIGVQPHQTPEALKFAYGDDREKRMEAGRFWIEKGLAAYEALLTRGRPGTFSFGAQVTHADLCLIPQVYNALRFEVDLTRYPLIEGIYQRCLETKACDEAAPHNQPDAKA